MCNKVMVHDCTKVFSGKCKKFNFIAETSVCELEKKSSANALLFQVTVASNQVLLTIDY